MEKETKPVNPSYYRFSLTGVIKSGFFAAIITSLLMLLQGNNTLYYFGVLVMGEAADPKFIYLAGIGLIAGLGIIFAFLYAIILAPFRINDLIKAIIFAVILTGLSYFLTPQLPYIINKIAGKTLSSQVVTKNLGSGTEMSDDTGDSIETAPEVKDTQVVSHFLSSKANIQKNTVTCFIYSLLFSLMVVVLYRCRYY